MFKVFLELIVIMKKRLLVIFLFVGCFALRAQTEVKHAKNYINEDFDHYIKKGHTTCAEKADENYGLYDCGPVWSMSVSEMSVKTTSFLKNYKANNILDQLINTAWISDSINVIGQKIVINCIDAEICSEENPDYINQITFLNGYSKNKISWKEYGRVKKVRMYINGAFYTDIELNDYFGFQNVALKKINFLKSKYYQKNRKMIFTFEILEIYKGSKYQNVAIASIDFDGNSVN
jgi:hypothetical protein